MIVTLGNTGDAPRLPELVENTALRFEVKEVLDDKVYLSHRNFDAIEKVGAVPIQAEDDGGWPGTLCANKGETAAASEFRVGRARPDR